MDPEKDITNERYYHGIDIIALISYILRRLHWIILGILVGFVVARYYVTHYVTPIYQATSKIYIAGSDTTITISDLNLGSTLAKDYQEAFKIWHVHEMVDEKLNLGYSYDTLANMVSTNNPSGSHLLYITVKSEKPEEAQLLANTYAETVQDYIVNVMEMRKPQILEQARKPRSPISPNVNSTSKDGAVAGGMIVFMIFAIIFLRNDRIHTSEDIFNLVKLPVLGIIPFQHFGRNQIYEGHETIAKEHIPHAVIKGNLSLDDQCIESLNSVCTAISFAGKEIRSIVITSCSPNEGKTFVAFQISLCMAKRGKKTLLIDGDLRKSVMQTAYSIQLNGNSAGLAHILSGQCEVSNAVYTTNIPNLFIIPVGEIIQTPLALISSMEYEQLLKKLAISYDIIIIDTPPIGLVVDAAELARSCDGSLMVVENKKTHGRLLKQSVESLQKSRVPVLGCILNKGTENRFRKKNYAYGRKMDIATAGRTSLSGILGKGLIRSHKTIRN